MGSYYPLHIAEFADSQTDSTGFTPGGSYQFLGNSVIVVVVLFRFIVVFVHHCSPTYTWFVAG